MIAFFPRLANHSHNDAHNDDVRNHFAEEESIRASRTKHICLINASPMSLQMVQHLVIYLANVTQWY